MSFLRKQESSNFRLLWTPAFAGVTRFLTFYECIKFNMIVYLLRCVQRVQCTEGRNVVKYKRFVMFTFLYSYGCNFLLPHVIFLCAFVTQHLLPQDPHVRLLVFSKSQSYHCPLLSTAVPSAQFVVLPDRYQE